MTTIHSRNGNCVAALQPAPGDLFAVTLLGAKAVFIQPAHEYERALALAEAFAEQVVAPNGGKITVKVIGMSLTQLLAFKGLSREDFAAGINDGDLAQVAEQACKDLLRNSHDAAIRHEAYEILESMGVISRGS